MSVFAISVTAFQGCSQLPSIDAPSISSTTIFPRHLRSISGDDSHHSWLREILVDAGFTTTDPDFILRGEYQGPISLETMYYDIERWGRTRGADDRLPLFTAAARSVRWSHTVRIFKANMLAVYEVDELTGLPPSMLAAIGQDSDIESVYNLLREFPMVIGQFVHRAPARTGIGQRRAMLCSV